MIAALLALGVIAGGYLSWRYFWFFRDPERKAPEAAGLVSPADGTVVYVKRVAPGEPVIVIKQGVKATVRDLMREDADEEKLVIGIFMSPFDVHYNRAPLSGKVGFIHRHPAHGGGNLYMAEMHVRSLLGSRPVTPAACTSSRTSARSRRLSATTRACRSPATWCRSARAP